MESGLFGEYPSEVLDVDALVRGAFGKVRLHETEVVRIVRTELDRDRLDSVIGSREAEPQAFFGGYEILGSRHRAEHPTAELLQYGFRYFVHFDSFVSSLKNRVGARLTA